jgi:hypothetical protein
MQTYVVNQILVLRHGYNAIRAHSTMPSVCSCCGLSAFSRFVPRQLGLEQREGFCGLKEQKQADLWHNAAVDSVIKKITSDAPNPVVNQTGMPACLTQPFNLPT